MKNVEKTMKRFWPLYLMFLPGVIYLFVNCYIPMFGIQIAFRQYNARDGIYGSPWCGLDNFEFLFRTDDAFVMTRNTLLYNLVFIVLGTVLAIAVAIILNEVRSKSAKQVYQTVILIPYLISMVIVSYLAFAFLSSSNGYINNSVLKAFGMEAVDWYTQPQYWPVILVIINIWKGLGYNMILYYATICGIDHTLYEAAVVDGATRWQQIRSITLPSLKSTIIILTLMGAGRHFPFGFRPVLSGAAEFRPADQRDPDHRHIRVPRPDADEQHRHVLGGRRISVRRRLCPCDFRESHCPQAG